MKKTKFFRIAKAGATTDGRKIEVDWILQMAKNYDPNKFTARINLEHIKGIHPDWGFRNLGDVLALKTEKKGKDLYLLAQIAPTDELIAYTNARQKNFTSIEVNPNFADTGEAYLVGLAVTDNPASLGTEYLQFAAQNRSANIYASRKFDAQNLISESLFFKMELEETPFTAKPTPESGASIEKFAVDLFKMQFEQITAENAAIKAQLAELSSQCADFAEKFAILEKQPHPNYKPMPSIAGFDCSNSSDFTF